MTYVVSRAWPHPITKVWGLCSWCAEGTSLAVRGEPLEGREPVTEYEKIHHAVARQLGEPFALVGYSTGWVFRRRTFSSPPIHTAPFVRLVWVTPPIVAPDVVDVHVNGRYAVPVFPIDTPDGATLTVSVKRRSLIPKRVTFALVFPLLPEPPA